MQSGQTANLKALTERIRDIERKPIGWDSGDDHDRATISTGWRDVDRMLSDSQDAFTTDHKAAGLLNGSVHEWIGVDFPVIGSSASRNWVPPLAILTHLASRSIPTTAETGGSVVWVGRNMWPYPWLTVRLHGGMGRLLNQSIFLDPPDASSRLWAIERALRCPANVAVIADCAGMGITETRRLQLAAKQGQTLGLTTRPPHEQSMLSAATTRWHVTGLRGHDRPAWGITLLAAKGSQPISSHGRQTDWTLEWNHATSTIGTVSDMVYRLNDTRTRQVKVS